MILLRAQYAESLPPDTKVLTASDAESEEAMAKVKVGKTYATETKRARSPQQHGLFFRLIHKAFENQQTDFPNEKALRKAILIQAGYFEPEQRLTGEIVNVARSISYHNMGQDEFNQCFQDCAETICKYVMPGMDPETLINEVGQ